MQFCSSLSLSTDLWIISRVVYICNSDPYYIVHYIVQYVLYMNSTEILQYYYYTVLYSTRYCTQYQVQYMYYTMYYIILI